MKRRVLLKLSGEALAGEKHTGFDEPTVTKVAKQVKTLVDQGIEVGIVIGEETSGEDAVPKISTVPKQTRSVCWQPL